MTRIREEEEGGCHRR